MNLTPPTIRSRIVREMKAAVHAMTLVAAEGGGGDNLVIEADTAMLEQGGRTDEWSNAIKAAVGAGKVAVELAFAPDDRAERGDTQGTSQQSVDAWEMPVAVLAHLPEKLPVDENGQPMTPERCGDSIAAAIYRICGTLGPLEGAGEPAQCGRWLNLTTKLSGEPDGMPLAIGTLVVSKGGVGVSDIGTRATSLAMIVRYRTRTGRAEVLA